MAETSPVLEVQDLQVEFRLRHATVRAVEGVSLHVEPGESVGLVGESGCGKTTTALAVMQLLPNVGHVTGGSVRVDGRELVGLSERQLGQVRGEVVGMVFQDPQSSLNPTMRIGQQISEVVRLHRRVSEEEAVARAVEVLRLVDMPRPQERLRAYPHELSGGLRQRVMVAMALACEPKLLIADEPTTALDVTIQAQILDLIDDLRQRLHMGVLLVTHDMGVIAGRTDRMMVMYAGRIVEEGTTHRIFTGMRHRYTEALLASVPRLDQDRTVPLRSIAGLPPDLGQPVGHCRFAPRCGYAQSDCWAADPPLTTVGIADGGGPKGEVGGGARGGDGLQAAGRAHAGDSAQAVNSGPAGDTLSGGSGPGAGGMIPHRAACYHPVVHGAGSDPPAHLSVASWQAGSGAVAAGGEAAVEGDMLVLAPGTARAAALAERCGVLVVSELVKSYPTGGGFGSRSRRAVHAVSGVSFTVRRGETFGLVGESGCGKTTVGRLVVGLERADSGAVAFEGTDVQRLRGRSLRRARRSLQLMFQDPYASLDPRMQIGSILREPLDVQGIGDRRGRHQRVQRVLAEVGLPADAAARYPHELSGGQRQRVGLARALVLEPALIVADEPVSALDVSIQAQILNLLRELQQRRDLTYVFISHDLAVVKYVADTIGVMYLGKLVEIGPADDIYARTVHHYTQALLDAIPEPDPVRERAKEARHVHGELPSAVSPPSGCRFRTRCAFAQDVCAEVEPPLRAFGPGHLAACHFPLRQSGDGVPVVASAAGQGGPAEAGGHPAAG